jgi:hypothetical protein
MSYRVDTKLYLWHTWRRKKQLLIFIFSFNRLLFALFGEAVRFVEEGVTSSKISTPLASWVRDTLWGPLL